MSDSPSRTFVGFGFGAIQAGLFLFEAARSGKFDRIVVAEVVRDVVDSIRGSNGRFWVNVTHSDRIEAVELGPIEMLDPADEADRETLIAAVAEASEVGTAVPSIDFYASDAPESIHRILARGLERRTAPQPLVVYAAENHNEAAEALERAIAVELGLDGSDRPNGVACLNTVIGKMSGIITDPAEVTARGLRTINETSPRAFLVEAFNRILVTSPETVIGRPVDRGLDVFVEKGDLLPFEEAKLYGHNATHALAAYLAKRAGITSMDGLREIPGAVDYVAAAFLDESGAALVAKHAGIDELFTQEGFRAYVEDLIERMFNPHLGDLVERVARDPRRKLGWDDRLIGTLRLCQSQDVEAPRLARGAAVATLQLAAEAGAEPIASFMDVNNFLIEVWSDPDGAGPRGIERSRIVASVSSAVTELSAISGDDPRALFA